MRSALYSFTVYTQSLGAAAIYSKAETYNEVSQFLERLGQIEREHGYMAVRGALSTCLRNQARTWYATELPDFERNALQNARNLQPFCDLFDEGLLHPEPN